MESIDEQLEETHRVPPPSQAAPIQIIETPGLAPQRPPEYTPAVVPSVDRPSRVNTIALVLFVLVAILATIAALLLLGQ